MTPYFSIIIPTFNSVTIITENLEALNAQKFKNFEVIIQDSLESEDNLASLLKSFPDLEIKYSKERDFGIYDAMNRGIESATGEYILFLGADDCLYNESTLSLVHQQLSSNSVDLIFGNTLLKEVNLVQKHDFILDDLYFNTINHQVIFYKNCVFNLEKYDLRYPIAADQVLTKRLVSKYKCSTLYIDQTISRYSINGTSSNLNDRNFVQELQSENILLFPNLDIEKNIRYSNNIYIQYLSSKIDKKEYFNFFYDYIILVVRNRKPIYVRTLFKSLLKSLF